MITNTIKAILDEIRQHTQNLPPNMQIVEVRVSKPVWEILNKYHGGSSGIVFDQVKYPFRISEDSTLNITTFYIELHGYRTGTLNVFSS
jgi:hypothetical protein